MVMNATCPAIEQLTVGTTVNGHGYMIRITRVDLDIGEVDAEVIDDSQARPKVTGLARGDGLRFVIRDDWLLHPERYPLGDVDNYEGGWTLISRDGEVELSHTCP